MDRLWIVAALLATCAIGFVGLVRRNLLIAERSNFTAEFLDKLRAYVKSGGQDYGAYGWLTHRSKRMQLELGSLGVFASYRAPYANVISHNVPAIFTLLPQLRHCFEDEWLRDRTITHEYGVMLEEILVRHLGSLSDDSETIVGSLRNPVVWFREGMRAIIALPVSLLGWVGILTTGTARAIAHSGAFRLVAGVAALVAFFSAVVGLVVGWEQFAAIVAGWAAKWL